MLNNIKTIWLICKTSISCKIKYRQEGDCIIGFDKDIPMINISERAIITVNGKPYEGI